MPAGRYSFTIEQAATFSRVVTWYADAAGTQPVNLTGYSAKMKVKNQLGTALLDSANGDITITLGGAAGTVTVTIAAAKTGAMSSTVADDLVYDLELTSGTGVVTRLLQGTVAVSAGVTL